MHRCNIGRLWKDFSNSSSTFKGEVDQTIPMNDAARNVLENHQKLKGSPFCFPGRGGRQRIDIKKSVIGIKRAAGLPASLRPLHGLRHVYASMLASCGQVDLYTLQKLLAHKSPAMTQRYAHLRDEALKRASNLASDIVTGIIAEKQDNKKLVNLTGT
jgi:integrase